MFLPMVSNPDGARRRVMKEEAQNMLGKKNGFTRELYPTLIAPSALESRVSQLREQATERRRATPSITVGGHARLGQNKAAHVTRR